MKKRKILSLKIDSDSFYTDLLDVKQERNIAIYDLIEDNYFEIINIEYKKMIGPYRIFLSEKKRKILFQIYDKKKSTKFDFYLSILPLKQVLINYEKVYKSYFEAVKNLSPNMIETIDFGRKSLHDEGGQIIKDKFSNDININLQTGRRFFTLIFSLHKYGVNFSE